MKFNKESKHDKLYNEFVSSLPDVKQFQSAYKFGVASVVSSIDDFCNKLNERNIKTITTEELRKVFLDWVSFDKEVNLLFNELLEKKETK